MARRVLVLTGFLALVLGANIGAQALAAEIHSPQEGIVTGSGTSFTVRSGDGLDITLTSSETIEVFLEGGRGHVDLQLEPVSGTTSTLTFSGLASGRVYWLYRDSFDDVVALTADATGSFSLEQDVTQSHHLWIQTHPSTLYVSTWAFTDAAGVAHPVGWSDHAGNDLNGVVGTMTTTYDSETFLTGYTATLLQDVDQTIVPQGITVLDGNGHTSHGAEGSMAVNINKSYHSQMTVQNLTFTGNWWAGVYMDRSGYVKIRNCRFAGIQNAIYNSASSACVYEGNVIEDCDRGVVFYSYYAYSPGDVAVQSNTIRNCRMMGVSFTRASSGIRILDNVISGCPVGIDMSSTWDDTISGNTIESNGVGLWIHVVEYTSGRNHIYNNNFVNNGVQAYFAHGTLSPGINNENFLWAALPTGGNYWSDWTGPELNGDGIVDAPYAAPGDSDRPPGLDLYPWARPNGWMNANFPPVLATVGAQTVPEGQTLTFTLSATDANPGQVLTFSAANLPSGATFDTATGTFTWTPSFDQAGVYPEVEFSVTDSGIPLALDVELITITVGDVNRPPVFAPVGPKSVSEYDTLSFGVSAADPDGGGVALYAGALPPGAAFDPATGIFTWRPDGTQAGVYPLSFFAVDGGVPPLSAQVDVVITVGQVTSPVELGRETIDEIVARDPPTELVNSYLANLKKVEIFVNEGKLGPAINQVQAFIQKTTTDIEQGLIPAADGEYLLMMANDLLSLLQG